MGRPKGSVNKKNSNGKGKDHVTPGKDSHKTQAQAASGTESDNSASALEPLSDGAEGGASDPASAAGESGSTPAGNPEPKDVVGGLDDHRAPPAPSTDTLADVPALREKAQQLWGLKRAEEDLKASDAKRHSDAIKGYESEIDKLYARVDTIIEDDCDEVIDRDRGIVSYVSRTTDKIVRTRALMREDDQEKIRTEGTIGNTPITLGPPKPTFDQLQEGKVWEHDEHGCVRVLAILDGSVRVRTEDLDEDDEGIEIGQADWNANGAHPREVPTLEIGQRWLVDRRECTITVLDDCAACVTWSDNDEPGSVSRLSFCAEGAKHIVPIEIKIGDRLWLNNKSGPIVVVLSDEVDGHCLCQVEGGEREQIEVERLRAGDSMMPATKSKKNRRAQAEA